MKTFFANITAGLFFVPFLSDDFFKFLAIAVPATISIVTSLFSAYAKLRKLLVREVTDAVMAKLREELTSDREKVLDGIGDELWSRLDVLSAMKRKKTLNEKEFDVKELAAK